MNNKLAFDAYKQSYDFIKTINKNKKILLKTKDPKYCYHFLENIIFKLNINIPELEIQKFVSIIEKNIFYYQLLRERFNLGLNEKDMVDKLIKTGNAKNIFIFALKFKNVDKNLLFEGLLKTKNVHYIIKYINEIDFDKSNYDICYFL